MKYVNKLGAASLTLLIAVGGTCVAAADSFSCLYGSQPACLDAGDTVCTSHGKCVSDDAVCFDGGQCDYQGYTCRSTFTQCVEEYEGLEGHYNSLVDEYNTLTDKHDDLIEEHLALLEEAREAYGAILSLYDCVEEAKTLEEAKACE